MTYQEKKSWLLFGLPLTFTKYTLTEEQIIINTGFLNQEENNCYMYKVQDTVLSSSLLQRMAGLGTVVCKTSDVTHPQLVMKNIKNARKIKDFIIENSEDQRMKRRTINTLNISAEADSSDLDGDFN